METAVMDRVDTKVSTEVRIDIADLIEEALKSPVIIEDFEDVVDAIRDGYKTGEVARLTLAKRHMGVAEPAILATDKVLYISGARQEIAERMAKRKRKRQIANGETVEVREFVGHEDSEGGFVDGESSEAMELISSQLVRHVAGYVDERFKLLSAADEDVAEHADQLIAAIRKIEKQYT